MFIKTHLKNNHIWRRFGLTGIMILLIMVSSQAFARNARANNNKQAMQPSFSQNGVEIEQINERDQGYLSQPEIIMGKLANLVLDDNGNAFVTHGRQISAINISDKQNPQLVSEAQLPNYQTMSRIYLTNAHLYTLIDGQMFAISVEDPSNMQIDEVTLPTLDGAIKQIYFDEHILLIWTTENTLYSMRMVSSQLLAIADEISLGDESYLDYFQLDNAIYKDGKVFVSVYTDVFVVKIDDSHQFWDQGQFLPGQLGYPIDLLEIGGLITLFQEDPGDLGSYYGITSWNANDPSQPVVAMYSNSSVPHITASHLGVIDENYVIDRTDRWKIQHFALVNNGNDNLIWQIDYSNDLDFNFTEIEEKAGSIAAITENVLYITSVTETGELVVEGSLDFDTASGPIAFCEERLRPATTQATVYGFQIDSTEVYEFDITGDYDEPVTRLNITGITGHTKRCIFDNVNNALYLLAVNPEGSMFGNTPKVPYGEIELDYMRDASNPHFSNETRIDTPGQIQVIRFDLETLTKEIATVQFPEASNKYYYDLTVNDTRAYAFMRSYAYSDGSIFTFDIATNGSLIYLGSSDFNFTEPEYPCFESGYTDNILIQCSKYAQSIYFLNVSDPSLPQELSELILDVKWIYWGKRITNDQILVLGVRQEWVEGELYDFSVITWIDITNSNDPQIVFQSIGDWVTHGSSIPSSNLYDLTASGFASIDGSSFIEYKFPENPENMQVVSRQPVDIKYEYQFVVGHQFLLYGTFNQEDHRYFMYKSRFLDNLAFHPIVMR